MNDLMFDMLLFLGTYKYLIILILIIIVVVINIIKFKIINNRMKKIISAVLLTTKNTRNLFPADV